MTNRSTARKVLAAIATAALLSSCSTLPRNSDPQVLGSFHPSQPEEDFMSPQPDRAPDLLLRDFYSASAIPTQDYQSARSFLTPETSDRWQPKDDVLIVDHLDVNTQAGATGDRRVFDIRGDVVGRLMEGGTYRTENFTYEGSVTMTLDGEDQWRISSLPDGVVIERSELDHNYEPQRLFFPDPSGRNLVGDRRWIYAEQPSRDAVLINLLLRGPSGDLRPGVQHQIPASADYVGIENGSYVFTGFGNLTNDQRIRFGAQLVWTLADAEIPGPYSIIIDGTSVTEDNRALTTDDFAAYNPGLASSTVSPLYALSDGSVMRVAGNDTTPVPGALSGGSIESADIAEEGVVAAVRRQSEGRSELLMGELDGELSSVVQADTISRPSFEVEGSAAWVVTDGHDVVRAVRSETTGEIARRAVNTDALDDIDGDISVLRLSRTGVRVAMIINGQLYTGVVEVDDDGERSIVNVTRVGQRVEGAPLSVDWQPDGSLVVGTTSADTPISRIEQDNSSATALPSGNLTAPVVAVASGANSTYLTDALAIRQTNAESGSGGDYWTEVPGLEGRRSAPIVAR